MTGGVPYAGFDEIRAMLAALPLELNREVRRAVERATESTARDLKTVYPGTDMQRYIRTSYQKTSGAVGLVGTVYSGSILAHLWEWGTADRYTQAGWFRGAEPAHPDRGLITLARRYRKQLHADVADILEQAGFTVTEAV